MPQPDHRRNDALDRCDGQGRRRQRFLGAAHLAIANAAGVFLAVPWTPGPPRRGVGVRSMLRFGGLATCNSFLVFLAWNSDNILLGRFWGAHALGLYGRAYQLATLPVEQLTSTLSSVAISGLSAIQDDADRLSRSFLRATLYSYQQPFRSQFLVRCLPRR
jgi:PST family polysaccharide transporter